MIHTCLISIYVLYAYVYVCVTMYVYSYTVYINIYVHIYMYIYIYTHIVTHTYTFYYRQKTFCQFVGCNCVCMYILLQAEDFLLVRGFCLWPKGVLAQQASSEQVCMCVYMCICVYLLSLFCILSSIRTYMSHIRDILGTYQGHIRGILASTRT